MNLPGRRAVLLSLSGVIALIPGCCSTPRAGTVSPVSAFAVVDGVKLHYLDWGGKGEPLIFIAGTGSTAHTFDELAPRFTDHFHVLALTRRGFGKSDKPPSGYDVPTLTEDVRGFLDEKHIDRANFVCHSAGGDEVTHFASTYPQRTGKLVYLEAAYDRSGVSAMEASDPMGADVPRSPEQALHWKGMDAYKPDFTRLKGPVLAFYATFGEHWAVNDKTPPELALQAETYMETVVRPHQQHSIRMFERDVPTARVIVLDDTDHYFFEDPKLSDYVVDTMRAFLLGQD